MCHKAAYSTQQFGLACEERYKRSCVFLFLRSRTDKHGCKSTCPFISPRQVNAKMLSMSVTVKLAVLYRSLLVTSESECMSISWTVTLPPNLGYVAVSLLPEEQEQTFVYHFSTLFSLYVRQLMTDIYCEDKLLSTDRTLSNLTAK